MSRACGSLALSPVRSLQLALLWLPSPDYSLLSAFPIVPGSGWQRVHWASLPLRKLNEQQTALAHDQHVLWSGLTVPWVGTPYRHAPFLPPSLSSWGQGSPAELAFASNLLCSWTPVSRNSKEKLKAIQSCLFLPKIEFCQ